MDEQMSFSNASIPIGTVLNSLATVNFGGLDLQPPYQRGYVWKDDFKDKLIYSIVKQYPTGNISVRVLAEANAKGAKSEVVDGQQRLTTIKAFVDGSYVIKSEWSRKIIVLIREYFDRAGVQDAAVDKLTRKLQNKGSVSLRYSDLPPVIQGNLNSYNIPMTYIANATDVQIREYFRFLQNQERLRAGEIINSMPATNLERFLDEIADKEKFLDIISFTDGRGEFDKIFYSIIGLFDEKLPLGSTDKAIQGYASKAAKPSAGLARTRNLIEQVNAICELDQTVVRQTRKRYLKYLLLLCGFHLVDFQADTAQKLVTLKEIDDKLSVFFSAKANMVENEFQGYAQEIIDEYRYVALLTKGGHSLRRVENRMEILAYYINHPAEKRKPSGVKLVES